MTTLIGCIRIGHAGKASPHLDTTARSHSGKSWHRDDGACSSYSRLVEDTISSCLPCLVRQGPHVTRIGLSNFGGWLWQLIKE